LFPALELKETSSWSTHFFLAAFVLLFAVFGMIKGFLHHRNKTPIFLASLGAILILSALTVSPEHAHVDLDAHTMLTVLGSIMLVGSHAANLKSCRRCSCKKVAVVHHDTIKPNRRLAVVNE
jgi:ribose/xylose/arabinose/galactoside ABC-type transport system permease subunit